MDSLFEVEFQHTYLVFKKLERENFLFENWSDSDDESLNYLLREMHQKHYHLREEHPIKNSVLNLIVINYKGYKFVFIEEKQVHLNFSQIILVNYFPIDFPFPKNTSVITDSFDFTDQAQFIIYSSFTHYQPKELESILIDGEYYLIEEEKKYYEAEHYYTAINTHKPFCDFCDTHFNGRRTLT